MKQIRAMVYGRVQGVAFRAYTQAEATRLGITGWVMNQPDGSVRVEAAGSEAALHTLLAWLQHGPPAANVTRVETIWYDGLGKSNSFQIRH